MISSERIAVFSTCPQSREGLGPGTCSASSTWRAGARRPAARACSIYTDNGIVDPWLVAQMVIQSTERLAPLVAVQAAYMHPFTAANMVATLGHLYGRRLYLNLVAGGFRNDLLALNDPTPHDERYERTCEYAQLITRLLAGETVTFTGRYYSVTNLRLAAGAAERPAAGSDDVRLIAGRAGRPRARSARWRSSTRSGPPTSRLRSGEDSGVRVGIVARPHGGGGMAALRTRAFPEDRKGQLAHKLAMKVSDSHWHRQLAEMAPRRREETTPTGCGRLRTTPPSAHTSSAATIASQRSFGAT